ncbi:MAG: septum formation initiator family protein [Gemmatimonadota bacterium]
MTARRLADRTQRRRQKALFWGLVAGIAGYAMLAGDHRPYHLAMLYLEEKRSAARIGELRAEQRQLAAEEARLAGDSLALETLAREKGMIQPGDLVYRIVTVPPGVREAAAESLAAQAAAAAIAEENLARDSLHQPPSQSVRARAAAPDSVDDPAPRD